MQTSVTNGCCLYLAKLVCVCAWKHTRMCVTALSLKTRKGGSRMPGSQCSVDSRVPGAARVWCGSGQQCARMAEWLKTGPGWVQKEETLRAEWPATFRPSHTLENTLFVRAQCCPGCRFDAEPTRDQDKTRRKYKNKAVFEKKKQKEPLHQK